MKKFLSLVLVFAILLSVIIVPASADASDYSLVGGTVELDGENNGEIQVKLVTAAGGPFYTLQAEWGLTENNSSNFALSAMSPTSTANDVLVNAFTQDNNVATGNVFYSDAGYVGYYTLPAGGAIWTATYTVDADTPAGDYIIPLHIEVITGGTTDQEDLQNIDLTATVTVTRPTSEEPEQPTEPVIPDPKFELSYELSNDKIAVGGEVTATVSLTSDVDCTLQAYDVIVNADAALDFVRVGDRIENTTGGKADTDGTATEVRYVGEGLNAPMTAETPVTLFTITYELPEDTNAADGDTLAITLETPEDDNDSSASVGGTPEDFKPSVSAQTYSVTVDQKQEITFTNGDDSKVEEVGYNTPYTLPTADSLGFENEGYTFAGWDTNGDGAADKEAGDELKVKVDTTIKAVWTINEYTISWVVDGVTTTNTYEYGATVTAPANPTKTGYTFAGWDKTVPTTMPAENMTITATWTANQYTVSFYVGTGATLVGSDTLTVTYDGTFGELPTATKDGYTFAGWYYAEDKIESTTTVSVADDIMLEAHWEAIKYTVIFKDHDGTELKTEEVEYGKAATAPKNPTREGYTFTGWDEDFNNITGDLTVTAKYEINTYTVTFKDWNDDTLGEVQTVEHGGAATAPQDPTREGYTFTGWDKAFDSITGDLTVTAQYEINSYTVTFVANGETVKTETVEHGSAAIAPADPEREGYTFKEWDKSFNNITGDLTITATWTANKYTIKFVVDEGLTAPDVTVTYGEGFTLPNLEKDGYNLLGWSKSSSAEAADYTVGSNTNDLTTENGVTVELYPVWGINQYTVTFKDWNDSTLGEVQTVDHGNAATAPAAPTREGYTFTGWDKAFSNVTENLIVTAQYTINKYTITWVVDGKTTTEEYEYNTTPNFKGSTDKAADAQYTYTFKSWDKEIVAVTGDATYTATYTETLREYTITWIVDGNETTEEYEYGATPSFKGSTNKAADAQYTYTFTGWDKEIVAVTGTATYTAQYSQTVNEYTITWIVDGKTTTETYEYGATPSFKGSTDKAADAQYTYTFKEWTPAIVAVTGDATYTATYDTTVNKYTITWDVDGTKTEEKYEYGAAVVAPETPTKEGHTFAGWTPTIEAVTGDATYTATWTVNQYTVTFKNGDTTLKTGTLDYGAPIIAPADPTKEGHTFKGWSPAVAATVPASDVTYEATWTVNQYTVTFKDGDEVVQSGKLDYGADIIKPADPTKTGYTFAGWSPAVDATVPANDATYTATWTAIQYTITYVNGDDETKVYTIEDTVKVENIEIKANYTAQWNVTATDGGTDIGNWNATVYPGDSLTGKYGNVTLTAEWIPDINMGIVPYKYALAGDALLIVDANGLEGGKAYYVNGKEMYYTTAESYKNAIDAQGEGVFVYIVDATTDASALTKDTATTGHDLDVLKQKGDINDNDRTDISDANAVYQMVARGGDYYGSYTLLSIEARLIADMNTGDGATDCSSVNDAVAILNIMDGKPNN